MGNIKHIPYFDRPREKAYAQGISTLSDTELLAIIIGSGSKDHSALDIAQEVLDKCRGLLNLGSLSLLTLKKIKGISKAKSASLLAMVEIFKRLEHQKIVQKKHLTSSQDIYEMFRLYYLHFSREEVRILLLNNANALVKEILLTQGSFNSVNIDYRLIIAELLKNDCYKFILIHNHPSSSSIPSLEDINATIDLKKKVEHFKIKLVDHIIMASDEYYSFKDHALL